MPALRQRGSRAADTGILSDLIKRERLMEGKQPLHWIQFSTVAGRDAD